MKRAVLWVLLSVLTRSAMAQTPTETAEVAVNGPDGALLLMDGQAMGKLPLPVNLVVPAGPHRFRLELGKQKAESDALTIPANRQAALNLTLSGHTLVAVLRISDGLVLVLAPEGLPSELREKITASVTAMAKQEHSVLLGNGKQAALLRRQSIVIRCLDKGDCPEQLLSDGQVSYVLSLHVESEAAGDGGSYHLRGVLLDARTRDISARSESQCGPCDAAALSAKAGALSAKMLQETAARPRGRVVVTSTPDGAKVLLDGRWLGTTPFQQEAFAGPRNLEIRRDGYLPHKETIQVESNEAATVQATLQLAPNTPLARPLWRIVSGSVLIGGGILLVGFGTSALLANGQCQDGSSNFDTCTPYYSTAPVGGGLLGGGAALAIAGIIMLAVPSPRPSH